MWNTAYGIGRHWFIAVLLTVFALAPLGAYAQTSDIATLIAQLQAQIAALQAQINALQTQQSDSTPFCYTFNTNLRIGDSGEGVVALSTALGMQGFSAGMEEKGIFGETIASAVTGFQEKYRDEILTPVGLKYGNGFVGKNTRAKLNQLYGCNVTPIPIPANQPPVVSGVSGPTQLTVNQQGTWTVKAYDPEQGSLSYTVDWGDNTPYSSGGGGTSATAPSVSQSASFTHSYANAGTYNVAFVVTDVAGLSAKTSISVNVGGVTTQDIQVIYPNGGETLVRGGKDVITWNPGIFPASMVFNIDLVPQQQIVCIQAPCPMIPIIASYPLGRNIVGDKSTDKQIFAWIVGNSLDNRYIPDGTYKIQVCQIDGGRCDLSDSYFKITSQPAQSSIKVISPNGGETLQRGSGYSITWTPPPTILIYPSPVTTFDVSLVPYQAPCSPGLACIQSIPMPYTIVKDYYNKELGNGIYPWIVGNIQEANRIVNDGAYYIQVCQSGTSICDKSDSYFKITTSQTQPSITVLSPNGGEQWQLNSSHVILWTPYDAQTNINTYPTVQAYIDKMVNGAFVEVGKVLPGGKASIHWQGEINQYGQYPSPGDYYIRLVNSNTGTSDRSDQPFKLVAQGTVKADLKINGSDGPINVASDGKPIVMTASWSSNADTCILSNNTVPPDDTSGQRQLSNLPSVGSTLINVFPNLNSYNLPINLWCTAKVPEGQASDNVEVSASNIGSFVSINMPNGGEQINLNASSNISVSHTADITRISLVLYKNDASFRYIIADLPVNPQTTGTSYMWTPSKMLSSTEVGINYKVYVIAYKNSGGTVTDISDAPFSIVAATTQQPSITITATSGSASSQSALNIKVGDSITISGAPQNLGSGFTRAFFFDPIFNDSCSNNGASDSVWTMQCTAKQTGTSNFYITIYQNGQTYRSNIIAVTVMTQQPTTTVPCNYSGRVGVGQFVGCVWKTVGDTDPKTADDGISAGDAPVANTMNFSWPYPNDPPINQYAGNDKYSARWKGNFVFKSGTYRFTGGADDGIRVRVNGITKIDQWSRGEYREASFDTAFVTQQTVNIEVDYFEHIGSGAVKLAWAPVSVSSTPAITVLSPNGGEQWVVGNTYPVRWTSNNLPTGTTVWIYLQQSGYTRATMAVDTSASNGTYNWTIPFSVALGGGYQVYVTSAANVWDLSDAPFSVVAATTQQPSITVLSPNGGEVWQFGTPYDITWTSQGVTTAYVALWFADGGVCKLAEVPANYGKRTVTISENMQCSNIPSNVAAGSYRILITSDAADPHLGRDDSDAPFSIVAQQIAAKPDIIISNVTFSPTSPKVNDLITTNMTVANNSAVAITTPFVINVQGTTAIVDSLGAWASKAVTVSNAFTFANPGTYSLNFPIDIWNSVDESNENNNTFTTALTFSSPTLQPSITTQQTSQVSLDINGDGAVDRYDANTLANIIFGSMVCSSSKNCDLNLDGTVNALDILKYSFINIGRDLNSDGVINMSDAELLANVILRTITCPVGKNCDINGSGSVSIFDLVSTATTASSSTVLSASVYQAMLNQLAEIQRLLDLLR